MCAQVSQSGQSRVEGAMPSGISKDLVRRVAINNTLVVTWANAHYADFAANFVNHMRRLKITNFLVGAMVRARPPPCCAPLRLLLVMMRFQFRCGVCICLCQVILEEDFILKHVYNDIRHAARWLKICLWHVSVKL